MHIKLEDTPIWDKVRTMYEESPGFVRAYHTFQHAQDVLNRVDEVQRSIGFVNYNAARIAALFHDVVYIPNSSYNEHESSRVMMDLMTNIPGVSTSDIYQARSLIIFTSNHTANQGFYSEWDTMLFLDCDLLGFGLSWEEYLKNNDQIDREFRSAKNFDERRYNSERIEFLKTLYRKGVFRSPYFRKLYEEKALSNIRNYLKELGIIV